MTKGNFNTVGDNYCSLQVDRSPTGSGVSARIAVQHAKGLIKPGQVRTFRCGVNGSEFTGEVVKSTRLTKDGEENAVIVQVSGKGHYMGKACFTIEKDDPFQQGFLPK